MSSYTDFNTYIKDKTQYFENILPVFNQKYLVSFTYNNKDENIFKYITDLNSVTDRIIEISPLVEINFSPQEISLFNDYKINLININNIQTNGELTIRFVEDSNYTITNILKSIMSYYHQGLNLTRNIPSDDIQMKITILSNILQSPDTTVYIEHLSIRYYGLIFTGLNEYSFEYGNKELYIIET